MAIPTRLLHISSTKLFTYPLGLRRTASDAEISVAWARADESYALHLKTLENSSPSAFTETEIERLAEDFLRRRGLMRRQFADVIDPELKKIEDERQEIFKRILRCTSSAHLAPLALPSKRYFLLMVPPV